MGQHSGYTPLIRADRLGAELGLDNLYLKDDSTCRPSLSYKDRVVSMSVARLLERGKTEIGCVSTGNVGTAVASLAAKAGVDSYVVYPNRLEDTKARACMALGAKVVQVEGNYDEANRRCREVAEATGMDFANITLRPFYAEGAKTAAFEIVEQLDWRAPDHIITAAAGGTLSSRLHKGLLELQLLGLAETDGTRIQIAQPSGCNPIATAILAEEAEVHAVTPETAAHSLAIGAPGDGYLVIDAVLKRGGASGLCERPGDLRRHRPAGRHRGPADRARRRDDRGGAREDGRRRQVRPRRHGRGDHHRQRPEDARRPPAEAVAGQDRLRARRDVERARRAEEQRNAHRERPRAPAWCLVRAGTMEEIDPIHDLEQRRAEARRAVDEAGGGEAEGFEQAEQELIEHASHGDEHSTTPIFRDAEGLTEEEESVEEVYGEADEEQKPD